jgi:hypothetical protein
MAGKRKTGRGGRGGRGQARGQSSSRGQGRGSAPGPSEPSGPPPATSTDLPPPLKAEKKSPTPGPSKLPAPPSEMSVDSPVPPKATIKSPTPGPSKQPALPDPMDIDPPQRVPDFPSSSPGGGFFKPINAPAPARSSPKKARTAKKQPDQIELPEHRPIFTPEGKEIYLGNSDCHTAFLKRGVLPSGCSWDSPHHAAFAQGVGIYNLVGRGADQYCGWLVHKQNSRRALVKLLEGILCNDDLRFFYSHESVLKMNGLNPIFVEKSGGVPYGKYMSMICNPEDRRRSSSFLIALFGRRNKYPCDCCMRRLGRYRSGDGVPVMVPFFECRSIDNFKASACANCVYHVEGGQCDFNCMSHFDCVKQGRAPVQAEFEGMPESELDLGQHTQVGEELSFDEAREEWIGRITGKQPHSRKPRKEEPKLWI